MTRYNETSIKPLALAISSALALSAAPQLSAQELEVVIVNSQRRDQNVQDVPIAITTFTGAELEVKAVTQVADVGDFAPNVYIDPTTPFGASNNILAAYIRGIGQSDFAFNLEPGVGVYVDGVYMARTIGANVDLLDVERMEVLKGPQGTLFGRNTIGGAIHVVTRRPGNEFRYRGEVTTGSYNRLDIRGAAEGPIIEDKLFGLLAFSSKDRDGYQDNIVYPGLTSANNDRSDQFIHEYYDTKDTNGGEDQVNFRGKLLWDVSDSLEIQFTGGYSNTDEDATATSLLSYVDDPTTFTHLYDLCIGAVAGGPPLGVIQTIPPCFLNRGIKSAFPSNGAPQYTQPALNGSNLDADPWNDRTPFGNAAGSSDFIHPDPDKSYATGPNFSKLEIWDGAFHLDYALENGMDLKLISSLRKLQFNAGLDFDSSPLAMLEVSFDTYQKQFSNELQLSGEGMDGQWEWVAGLYQFHEEGDLTDFVTFPGGFLQIYGENYFDTDAWAFFTHNNFGLTDSLSLTFGLRYTDEDREFEGRQRDLNMVGVNPTLPIGWGCDPNPSLGCSLDAFPDQNDLTRYYPLGVNQKTFDDTSIKLGLEYQFSDLAMGYVSYSEGFKGGGWTTRLSTPHLSVDPIPPGTFVNAPNALSLDFDQEEAESVEFGLKSEWLERTLLLNVAYFMTDYKNIQVTKQVGPSPVFDNAGDGEIDGLEAEFTWLAGARFTLGGSIGWLDAKYTEIDAGVLKANGVDPLTTSDMWVNVPEWDYNLAATYDHPLSRGGAFSFTVDFSQTSELANDFSNTPELMQDSVSFVNASVTYTHPDQNWSLTVGGRNLTDERHIITGQHQPAAGMILGTWNRPEEYYVSLRVKNF